MPKGERTREAILSRAVELASVVGLRGLTVGNLAFHTGMSKSGLFAHFGSKETLRLETLKAGVGQFTDTVVKPALSVPRGVGRIETLFDRWLAWAAEDGPAGGCLLVAAAIELDDEAAGPVRDYLVEIEHGWSDILAGSARFAIAAGDFRPDLDCAQFAYEFNSITLGFHQARRLLRDPDAAVRARRAFERLVTDATA